MITTPAEVIGVESKRFEPFRGAKRASLSAAYDRPVWGDRMVSFEQLRDDLRSGRAVFKYLDATQLVKHALGLLSEGRRTGKRPTLVYLFAEPTELAGRPIPAAALAAHTGTGSAVGIQQTLRSQIMPAVFRSRFMSRSWRSVGADLQAIENSHTSALAASG